MYEERGAASSGRKTQILNGEVGQMKINSNHNSIPFQELNEIKQRNDEN